MKLNTHKSRTKQLRERSYFFKLLKINESIKSQFDLIEDEISNLINDNLINKLTIRV